MRVGRLALERLRARCAAALDIALDANAADSSRMTSGRDSWLATLALAVVVAACGVSGPSRITIENRTTEDVVILTGIDTAPRVFVPACGQAVWELGRGARPAPTTPPGATVREIAYEFPMAADAATIATFTITSERIWTGALPSPPPCSGSAPASSE